MSRRVFLKFWGSFISLQPNKMFCMEFNSIRSELFLRAWSRVPVFPLLAYLQTPSCTTFKAKLTMTLQILSNHLKTLLILFLAAGKASENKWVLRHAWEISKIQAPMNRGGEQILQLRTHHWLCPDSSPLWLSQEPVTLSMLDDLNCHGVIFKHPNAHFPSAAWQGQVLLLKPFACRRTLRVALRRLQPNPPGTERTKNKPVVLK